MSLPVYRFEADAASGAPAGDYVSATLATQLESTLHKLAWTVLYGKSYDASGLAVAAEQLLLDLKKAPAAVAA